MRRPRWSVLTFGELGPSTMCLRQRTLWLWLTLADLQPKLRAPSFITRQRTISPNNFHMLSRLRRALRTSTIRIGSWRVNPRIKQRGQ